MGTLIEKSVVMGPSEWRECAEKARNAAVKWAYGTNQSDRLARAAEMLRAASTFDGHANMLDMSDDIDTAEVEHWDLSDEGIGGDPVPAHA